jgi:UDP-N-acetylmuramate--alanine ligase
MAARQFHVAGVAGTGMSALAQVLQWRGFRVTGSDRFLDQGRRLPVLKRLEAAGVELFPQDGSAIGPETAGVAYSTAIEETNPEVRAARRLGVPLRHRAEVLAEAVAESGAPLLAVAGTSGKTTTAGMLGHALAELGADPTVVNGGALSDWAAEGRGTGAVRRGAPGAPWVVEADESDRSFLRFRPAWSVVTNLSHDHFGMEETVALFREYAERVERGIVCGAGVARLLAGNGRPADFFAEPEGETEALGLEGCRVRWRGTEIRLRQVGRHAGLDALLAAELCFRQGYAPERIAEALSSFGGIQRRMEEVGARGAKVRVFDDYAHNAAKIAAALAAAEGGKGRVLAVWRPHGYAPLRNGMDDLAAAFSRGLRPGTDALWLLPVFDAGGTATRDVKSADLAEKIRLPGGVQAELPEDFGPLEASIREKAREGDVVLVMGARDPELPLCARRLAATLG